jgi:hypothetical protein
MENFNLKKFLVENKLTTNSRLLNEGTTAQDFRDSREYEAMRDKMEDIAANESDVSFEDAYREALAELEKEQSGLEDDDRLDIAMIIRHKDDIYGDA